MPNQFDFKYDVQSKILIIEHELPDIGGITWEKTVKLKTGLKAKPLNQKELKSITSSFYPSIILKLAYEIIRQVNCTNLSAIAINGWANYIVKATGVQKRAYCISFVAEIDKIKKLNLSKLEPLSAFNHLKGTFNPTFELTPIAPKITLDMSDKRFIEEFEVIDNLNQNANLACMNWEQFEHLCRELFERVFASIGATVKVTQSSRDQGVDAIIFDPDPVRGGKIIVQAKRYVNPVSVSAVRDLFGTISNEGAMKGILVTTSYFGSDSYTFAQGKPITLINGNELLGLLETHDYKFRIDLNEAKEILQKTRQK